ncbi:hypothetical protein [Streptomyces xylophagus]|uniref:hypothetical protein n=1 Tax=Streptomyces xylophagus TaxID=285514 RepID=UPI0005B78CB8|nr:hypothetical protein [Streptomyces xylophagus]
MLDQLSGAVPHGPELYWDLTIALVFALVAPALLHLLKEVRRIPRLVIPRVKALDLTNPFVLFILQTLAVLVALEIFHVVGTR